MSSSRLAVGSLLAVLVAGLVGCGGSGDPNTTDPKVLFEAHCAKCHAQAGEPGGPGVGGSRGPNLAKIGAGRDAAWLADYIRDPKSKKPDPKLMPAFGDKLNDAQIKALAEYLAAKK